MLEDTQHRCLLTTCAEYFVVMLSAIIVSLKGVGREPPAAGLPHIIDGQLMIEASQAAFTLTGVYARRRERCEGVARARAACVDKWSASFLVPLYCRLLCVVVTDFIQGPYLPSQNKLAAVRVHNVTVVQVCTSVRAMRLQLRPFERCQELAYLYCESGNSGVSVRHRHCVAQLPGPH